MKKLLFAAAFVLVVLCTGAYADTYVNGYYRKDGTYVQGHYKTPNDPYFYNNYSSQGNYNPYNGKKGYKKSRSPYGY